MALNKTYFGIAALVLMLVAVYVGAAGLTINDDGTLGSISVTGTVTTTGNVIAGGTLQVAQTIEAQAGFGYVPIGTILPWYNVSAAAPLPTGWYKCDGQAVAVTSGGEADLLDGATNASFATPNLNANVRDSLAARGVFLRGGATAGAFQSDAFQGHRHGPSNVWYSNGSNNLLSGGQIGNVSLVVIGDPVADTHSNGTPRTDNETRPLNMSVIWIIRVK